MSFYQLLQLDPTVVKPMIRKAESPAERRRLWFAMASRSLLIVLFAVLFIGTLGRVFGDDNMPLAVVIFCMFLAFRFVGFGFSIGSSLGSLALTLALLTLAPSVAQAVPVLPGLAVHAVAFFAILFLTCQHPEMGNGGVYNFAYVYLSGNPVYGEALMRRGELAVTGFVLCAALLLLKHRKDNAGVTVLSTARDFSFSSPTGVWMTRLAVGTACALAFGRAIGLPRSVWLGFAAASLFSTFPYDENGVERCIKRIQGALLGSAIFFAAYSITPEQFLPFLGPLGGFTLGFCTDYRYKTMANCFGAISMAATIYGIGAASVLRVFDASLGAIFAVVFMVGFRALSNLPVPAPAAQPADQPAE